MDGLIKIYPGSELKAVDMAELMKASLISDGILQGCRLSLNSANTAVHMTSGRIVIFGRLAEFAEGDLTPPTVTSDGVTCYICAVCDLSNTSRPFYVDILTASGKSDLDTAVETVPDDEFFNVSFGTRYLVLGTVTVSTAGTLSNLNTDANNYPIKSNKQVIDTRIATIDHTLGDHASYLAWINNRKWSRNKLSTKVVTYPSVTVPANSRAGVTINLAYGASYTATASGSMINVHENPGTDDDAYVPQPDEYGRETHVDTRHKVIGISGITFANAAVGGGVNGSKCVVAGWNMNSAATDTKHHTGYIYVFNTANSQAVIDVSVRVLYAQYE